MYSRSDCRLVQEILLLFLYPSQFLYDCQAHIVIADMLGYRYTDLTIRRINGQMQVFDIFPHHLHADAADRYAGPGFCH